MRKILFKNIGPIQEAEITLGDLTVFVGGQAMGKSISLELIKLVEDAGYIHHRMENFGLDCSKPQRLWSNYFGAGKEKIFIEGKSAIIVDGKPVSLKSLAEKKRTVNMRCFYIPAQRVTVISTGWPMPFQGFDAMTPFVTREFSENIRSFMDTSFNEEAGKIFPQNYRLNENLRIKINETIFYGQKVQLRSEQNRKMLILEAGRNIELPIATWSTGQREFIPLLAGLYYCIPGGGTSRRENIRQVILEEPEMGLHPAGVISVMLVIMEMLRRGYQVIISTHSPTVLDVVWALQEMKKTRSEQKFFRKLFDLPANNYVTDLFNSIMKKSCSVSYFSKKEDGVFANDISPLDPGSTNPDESGWGGLSGFSGRIADIVGEMVGENDN